MDFKQLVMNEVDTKYQEMDKGTIASPLSKNPVVSSNSTYEKKREEYYKRLSREHSEFNKAVSKIINNRDARIKSENEERRIREEKRSKRRASTKKFFKTILVLAIIIGLAFALWKFILWPKVIYPKLDADSLYTPEILQSYCQSSGGRDEIFTFTECSESGQVSATWEIYSSNEAWLIKLTGRITEKKNSGDITIKWSSNEVVYKPSSGSWSREVTATISDNYETLKTDSDVFSAGTNDKNIISTAEDFKKLTNSEGTYFLKNDIDLSGKNWTPITGFKGTLIGNGHKISNLRIKLSSSNVGFFSTLEGTVRDVTFENANINVQGSYENVGILCGTLKGHISGIKVSGTVAAPSSMRVGGIVGFYDRSSKSIAFSDLENAAKVTGKRIVGGVFGLFANTYGSSSAMTRLDRFTNSGAIYGTEDTVGGVVGYINASTVLQVSDFKNTGSVKGISTVGGIVGSVASTYDGSYIQNSSCSARIEGAAVVGCIAGDTRAAINNCTNKGSTLIANGSLLENGNKYAYVGGFAGKGYIANNCTNEVNINYTAGGSYVGGVIGYMQVNSKNITMTNLSNKAQVSGASYVGGIYGFLYNSYGSSSATTQLDKFTNSGAITGSGDYVGGTIGFINARCMLYMSDFKNTGSVKGVTNIGGIIGYAEGYSGSYIQDSTTSTGAIIGVASSVEIK